MSGGSWRRADTIRPSSPRCLSSPSLQSNGKISLGLNSDGPPTSVRRKGMGRQTALILMGCRASEGPTRHIPSETRRPMNVSWSPHGSFSRSWTSGHRAPGTRFDRHEQRRVLTPDPVLELTERLGVWSLRWQDAQDNSAKSRAARYQALSDHLGRMTVLEDRRSRRKTGQGTGGLAAPMPTRGSAEVARFFRPIDEWEIDRIIPTLLVVERPVNPLGVGVTPAEEYEIADRVYHEILDQAVDQFLASPRGGQSRANEVGIFDAPLAERLGFWSDLWRQSQEAAAQIPSGDHPRLATARFVSLRLLRYEPRARSATRRRCGHTSSKCASWRPAASGKSPSNRPANPAINLSP